MNAARRWLAILLVASAPAAAQTAAQDGGKILHVTFQAGETGFDPVRTHDYYSGHILEAVFDTLLTYDYLARPAKLVPNAAAMPEISADGRTYTFRIRKGIYYTDDPAFKGGKRELFFTFADASSGEESYGFRFLRAKLDSTTSSVVLDFNFAYNPDCALSRFTTCPLPPPENRIRTKVLAGERPPQKGLR